MSVEMIFGIGGISGLMAFILLLLAIRTHRHSVADGSTDAPEEEPQGLAADDDATGRLRSRMGSVLRPSDKEEIEALKNQVTQAGLYNRDALDLYLTVRLSLMLGGLVLYVEQHGGF